MGQSVNLIRYGGNAVLNTLQVALTESSSLTRYVVADDSGKVYYSTASAGGGGGTVTNVSVATANGLAGSVANPTTTPAITLSTTVTGILKGNGTAISAASAGTDYITPTQGTASWALNAINAITASYFSGSVLNAISASYAATASFIPNVVYTTGSQNISGLKTFADKTTFNNHAVLDGTGSNNYTLAFKQPAGTLSFLSSDYTEIGAFGSSQLVFNFGQLPSDYKRFTFNVGNLSLNTPRTFQFPDKTGTLLINDITSGSVATASFAFTSSYTLNAVSASYALNATSASYALNSTSASYTLNATSASFALTASSADDFIVRGTLTAQTIVAQTITSSTDFVTGSTRFGILPTNTHQFTGSVSITGSLSVNNSSVVLGTGSAGQVAYWNSTNSQAGNSNLFWDNTNARLGIGLTNPQRVLEIHSTTADNHLRLSGDAPSVSMGDSIIGGSYQAKFGLATANGQYAAAAVAGDFVILSQTGATIFMTSATEKMRVTAAGDVGIGTTSPTQQLQTTGDAIIRNAYIGYISAFGTDYASFSHTSRTGSGDYSLLSDNVGITYLNAKSGQNLRFRIDNIDKAILDSNGNFGIGTTSPSFKLDIDGSFRSRGFWTDDSAVSYWGNGPITSSYGILTYNTGYAAVYATSGNNLRLGANNSISHLFISASGNVGIGTTSPVYKLDIYDTAGANLVVGAATGKTFVYADDTAGAIGTISSIPLRFSTDTTERMRITSTGNVGIGTTSPSSTLTVSGSISGSGAVYFKGITSATQTNIVSIDTTTGQLYYQATGSFVAASASYAATASNVLGGTTNYLARWTSATTLGIGVAYDNGTNVGIGTTSPSAKLNVIGNIHIGDYATSSSRVIDFRTGNSVFTINTDGTSAALGTNIAYSWYDGGQGPLKFSNAGGEVMRLDANGQLGIGTTSPQKPLEAIATANDFVSVGVSQMSSGSWAGIHFGYRESNNLYRKSAIVFERTDLTSTNAQGKVHILNGPQAGSGNATLSDARLTIGESGNVGIGTTSPADKLDVAGDVVFGSATERLSLRSGAIGFNRKTSDGAIYDSSRFAYQFNHTPSATNTSDYLALQIYSGSGTQITPGALVINGVGNVGIGTTSPGVRLQIVQTTTFDGIRIVSSNATTQNTLQLYHDDNKAVIETTYLGSGAFKNLCLNTQGGNVGIGTTSPNAKLQIAQAGADWATSGTIGTGLGSIHLSPSDNTANYGNAITFGARDSSPYTVAHAGIYIRSGGGFGTTMAFGTTDSYDAGAKVSMFIDAAGVVTIPRSNLLVTSGNAGIGTTSPDVFSRGYSGRILGISSAGQSAIELNSATGNGAYFDMGVNSSRTFGIYSDTSITEIATIGARPLQFTTSGSIRMYIASGGNVGIGTTSPATLFYVNGYTPSNWITTFNNTGSSGHQMYFGYNDGSTTRYGLYIAGGPGTGVSSFDLAVDSKFYVTSGGNVGIGTTSPAYKLDVNGAARLNNLLWFTPTSGFTAIGVSGSNFNIYNGAGAETRLTVTNTGNVGLGVVPSAWGSTYKVLQFPGGYVGSDSTLVMGMGQNFYWNGSANIYVNNGFAEDYYQYLGQHVWRTAPSGTAGNAISFTQPMTLDASGRLGIGNTSPQNKLHVDGSNEYIRISNSSTGDGGIKISYQNSDTHGLHLIYNPSTAVSYIDNTYPTASGQVYGDIYFRQSVGSTMTSRMIIQARSGNVGIGTASPNYKLTVTGSNGVGVTAGNGNQLYLNNAGERYTQITFDNNSTSISQAYLAWDATDIFLEMYAKTGGGLKFYANATEKMRLTSGGNVSIGNTNDTYKLDVTGTVKSTQYRIAPNGTNAVYNIVDSDSSYAGFYIMQAGGGSSGFGGSIAAYGHSHATKPGWITAGISAGSGGKFTVNTQGAGGGTDIFVVQQDGNVGIGTTLPSEKLHISGNAYIAGVGNILYFDTDGATKSIAQFVNNLYEFHITNNRGNSSRFVLGNGSISLGTGSSPILYINTTNTNVGIGTTSPTSSLEIFSNAPSADRTLPHNVLTITAESSGFPYEGFGGGIHFKNRSYSAGIISSARVRSVIYFSGTAGENYGAGLAFDTTPTTGSALTEAMRIRYDGNVGIGTTSPSQKLEVVGGEIKAGRVDSGSEGGQVSFGRASDNATSWYIDAYGSTSSPSLRFVNVSNALVAMSITGSNVGIGTTSPSEKLEVNGNIKATNLVSGTYTPTLTAVYNVTSFTAFELQYMRVGNVVTVGGYLQAIATAANTWTRISITLPISSTFDFSYRAGGGGGASATNNVCAIQAGAFGTSVVYLDSYPNTTSNLGYTFSFTYLII